MPKPTSIAEYARMFASRGGKARKKALTPEERSTIARRGGKARAKLLSAAERSEAARRAVQARWRKARKKA